MHGDTGAHRPPNFVETNVEQEPTSVIQDTLPRDRAATVLHEFVKPKHLERSDTIGHHSCDLNMWHGSCQVSGRALQRGPPASRVSPVEAGEERHPEQSAGWLVVSAIAPLRARRPPSLAPSLQATRETPMKRKAKRRRTASTGHTRICGRQRRALARGRSAPGDEPRPRRRGGRGLARAESAGEEAVGKPSPRWTRMWWTRSAGRSAWSRRPTPRRPSQELLHDRDQRRWETRA
jgi:hypothetical protein